MLEHTPKQYTDRKALVVNPAKTCQPIGAMYAALGIHGCLPHSHGSQGCCSYHRMHLTRHYRDPIMASTSSFTEGACVFGGKSNLSKGLQNIFAIYNPDIVAVNTTCLSETIGDDIGEIIRSTEIPEGKVVIHANTPSYIGSHITGFANMVKAMVTYLAENTEEKGEALNIIPGFIEPSDMKEIRRMLDLLGIPYVFFPDTGGVVNAPMGSQYHMYPGGGATIDEIRSSGSSRATVALGAFASRDGAYELEAKCNIPAHLLKMPLGIEATDAFIMKILELTGGGVPETLETERGQLVDLMVDVHSHYHGKRVAVFGDPDIVISLTEFVLSLGMVPVHILTGSPGKEFDTAVGQIMDDHGCQAEHIKSKGDLMELHQWIMESPVDMIIGNSYGKYIARACGIPLVRAGFPILDRVGHSYFPLVGYMGAIRLIEKISTAFLDERDRLCDDEDLELVL